MYGVVISYSVLLSSMQSFVLQLGCTCASPCSPSFTCNLCSKLAPVPRNSKEYGARIVTGLGMMLCHVYMCHAPLPKSLLFYADLHDCKTEKKLSRFDGQRVETWCPQPHPPHLTPTQPPPHETRLFAPTPVSLPVKVCTWCRLCICCMRRWAAYQKEAVEICWCCQSMQPCLQSCRHAIFFFTLSYEF